MTVKNFHEIRDPIHVFVRLDDNERKVLDSRPFQRLRHIHQLALTYLVYPGASHKRFEHSLGVMELASRVFDVVTRRENITDEIRPFLREIESDSDKGYWRKVLRIAALCHDLGHLPFSHAAEKELLPPDWDHERLTREIIYSQEMQEIWDNITGGGVRREYIAKLAIGPKKATDMDFSDWEAILAEIIVGDAFGVDRMDYLLRDSHHTGVPYGVFDHHRLIDTLRILPVSSSGETDQSSGELALGVEQGGIQSAEALMLARYFMYSQVYFHPVRRIYDIHLMDFLKKSLDGGVFSTKVERHLNMTDNEITASLRKAAFEENASGYYYARLIVRHEHFKQVYSRNPQDAKTNRDSGKVLFDALQKEFGKEYFRHDFHQGENGTLDFPVLMHDDRIESSITVSDVLQDIPSISVDYIFADRSHSEKALTWLRAHRDEIIKPQPEEEDG